MPNCLCTEDDVQKLTEIIDALPALREFEQRGGWLDATGYRMLYDLVGNKVGVMSTRLASTSLSDNVPVRCRSHYNPSSLLTSRPLVDSPIPSASYPRPQFAWERLRDSNVRLFSCTNKLRGCCSKPRALDTPHCFTACWKRLPNIFRGADDTTSGLLRIHYLG
jgi:hypothetical protein